MQTKREICSILNTRFQQTNLKEWWLPIDVLRLAGVLRSSTLKCTLSVGREVKKEIPAVEHRCEILGFYGFYTAFSDL